jgi:hypothetical protein
MFTSTRLRRAGGVALAGAFAATGVSLTAAPASAAAYTGQAQVVTTFNTSGGGGCTISSGGGGNQLVPFNSPGTVNLSQSNTAVATDPGDAGDVTNMSASVQGTASLTEVGGALKTLDMTSTHSTTVQPQQGPATECNSTASSQFTTVGTVVVPSSSILDLTTKMRGGQSGNFTLVFARTTGAPTQVVGVEVNQNGKTRRVLPIPAGTYQLTIVAASQLGEPDAASDPTSDTVKIDVHGVMSAPGTALKAAEGTGTRYLKLPDTLNCAGHSLTTDFTSKAGKKATPNNGRKPRIRNAKFFVNDTKVKTKRKPHKNTNVTLSSLDDTDEVVIEVVLKLQDRSKVDIRRTYLPCS